MQYGEQGESRYDASTVLFCAFNNFMLYFLYILLGGITVTFVKGELTLELLTIAEDGDST